MSRYTLQSPYANLEIVVGWDAPLNTYFCVVEDLSLEPEEDDDEEIDPILFWIGTKYDEIDSVIESLGIEI